MDDELEGLAARFRRAIASAEASGEAARVARAERLEEGRQARVALLTDLVAFAQLLGVVDVMSDEEGVVWTFGDRGVWFRPKGSGDRVDVRWKELVEREGRLYREAQLDDRWVLAVHGPRGDRDRLPLRDAGLEHLLVNGLRLPTPSEETEAEPTTPPSLVLVSGEDGPDDEVTEDSSDPSGPSPKRRL